MTQKIKISLVAKYGIEMDGLRTVFSGNNFHIQASLSGETSGAAEPAGADIDGHVIVIDGSDSGFGIEACRRLVTTRKNARVALLLDHYVFEDVVDALKIGVDAIIIRRILSAPLVESIKLVALGEKVFPSQLVYDLTRFGPPERRADWRGSAASIGLSGREVEILESVAAGMANKVIARQFGICEATVKVHVKAILRKLGVVNRTQAATWGVKNGLAQPGEADLREIPPVRREHDRSTLSEQAA